MKPAGLAGTIAVAIKMPVIAKAETAAKIRVSRIFVMFWSFQFFPEGHPWACQQLCIGCAKLKKRQNSAILAQFHSDSPVHQSERLGIYANI
jgi:hypothetical protein